eukprot:CAMPEP_0182527500 /NCGR_PEP_ID=MMETSP1323-20130603/3885_1 /TAXON_ID=236787 /ORGANISM="Florenciella parvula, Strain RCC1693" /LENGTH=104 /DNA_ID=CAMNT_0024736491 /DNA_START=298 /DNA_END=613 /DNA_ORIENTATION=-
MPSAWAQATPPSAADDRIDVKSRSIALEVPSAEVVVNDFICRAAVLSAPMAGVEPSERVLHFDLVATGALRDPLQPRSREIVELPSDDGQRLVHLTAVQRVTRF